MSIEQMNRVWKLADVSQGTLLVLLALADWANDAGVCWPSVPKIALKARLSERQVRRIIEELQERKILTIQENRGRKKGGEYATSVYKINLTFCPILVDLKPATEDCEDLTFGASKPDIRDSAIRKEPSVNTTVKEPSIQNRTLKTESHGLTEEDIEYFTKRGVLKKSKVSQNLYDEGKP